MFLTKLRLLCIPLFYDILIHMKRVEIRVLPLFLNLIPINFSQQQIARNKLINIFSKYVQCRL